MSEVPESYIATSPRERVGADVGAIPPRLRLQHPVRLYKFDDVGAIFVFSRAVRLKVIATYRGPNGNEIEAPIDVPDGNWLLVGVGPITGDKPGFYRIDNPYSPAPPAPVASTEPLT